MEANLKCVETLERQVKENQPELAMMTAQILKSGGKFSTDFGLSHSPLTVAIQSSLLHQEDQAHLAQSTARNDYYYYPCL